MVTDVVMVSSYDHRLVALSILISILAAYAARDLSERVSDARGWRWLAWLIGGATVEAIGTWSMHYTGMLALSLPVPVQYDWPTVLLSLLVSIIGFGAALLVLSRSKIGRHRAVAASIFLGGVGISGMHYTAMAAMREQAMHHYSLPHVILSFVLAIVISLMALKLTFPFRDDTPDRSLRNHASAVLRGAANPAMHYTAMAGVTFTYSSEAPDLSHAVSIWPLGILGISIVDDLGIVAAIEWQAQQFKARTGIICQFDSFIENTDLSQEQATAIFRIFQEALTNILQHAQATRVNILIEEEEGEVVLEVKDNGRGIAEIERMGSRSVGLIGMRERAQLAGGSIKITGVAGKGTVLTLRIPIHSQGSN